MWKVKLNNIRYGSTTVSTILWKSSRFVIIKYFNKKTFQVEIWKICFPIPGISQPKKGDFRELKSKKFPRIACSADPPRSLCSFSKLVSIYPRSMPKIINIELDFAHSFLRLVLLQLDS